MAQGYCLRHGKELGLSCPDCNWEIGIKEVVEWINEHRYSTSLNNITVRFPRQEYEAKLKGWGIRV